MSNADLAVATHHPRERKHVVGKAIRFLARVVEYCRELGPVTGLRWYFVKVVTRLPIGGPRRVQIRPPGILHPVQVRMFPSSDDFVFDQLFVRHEYGLVCRRLTDPKFILDLGANVGYASAIFASRFPSARIVAVEPDPGNFELCQRNLSPYGDRIKVKLGAVWASRTQLALARGNHCDGREWATRVTEGAPTGGDASVQAWDVASLLDMAQQEEADFVKIDIEGSEAEVFAANADRWLTRVRNLCIELHGDRCREIFFNALRGFDYELEEFREFTFCFNLTPAVQRERAAQQAG
jgi:FkbM family methyltransferase